MLFLQDFNIRWGVERGINMGPTNALSRKDKLDMENDNREVTLLKGDNLYHHIQALDTTLAERLPCPPHQIP